MTTKTYTLYEGKILVNEGKNKTTYYYRTPMSVDPKRPKVNLGHNLPAAIQKLREIESVGSILPKTLGQVWDEYSKTALLERKASTQKKYTLCWKTVEKIFNDINLDDIKPSSIKRYLRHRKKALVEKAPIGQREKAGVSANREVAMISILFTHAINELDYDGANPCLSIKRHEEHGRDKYIEKWEYETLYSAADDTLKDVLDLLLFTGQRITDILEMKISDLRHNVDLSLLKLPNGQNVAEVTGMKKADTLKIKTNKTRKLIDILIEGELQTILNRILKKREERKINSIFLISDKQGQPYSYDQIYRKFKKARNQAGYESFEIQFRDLRRKNATDDTLENANIRLAHTTTKMTEAYRNNVMGVIARPLPKLT